jgi:hypothetical protein
VEIGLYSKLSGVNPGNGFAPSLFPKPCTIAGRYMALKVEQAFERETGLKSERSFFSFRAFPRKNQAI